MLYQQADQLDETPSQILSGLLKAADVVLAKARAHTLHPYGYGTEPLYMPAYTPITPPCCGCEDVRMCA